MKAEKNQIKFGIGGIFHRTKLSKMHNSFIIYLPSEQLELFGLKKGQLVDVRIQKAEVPL